MRRNVIGIINLHDCPHLGPLTMRRPTGATTFLGRYGLMDFTLSNFSNSGIDKVAILAESNVRSVRDHLQTGTIWVNNTRLGFQRVLTNEELLSVSKFNTDIANIMANKTLFYEEKPDYIIVAPTFMLVSFDYNALLEKHIASGADVTVLCKHIINYPDKDFVNCDMVSVDKDGFINGISTNTGRKKEVDISLESFVFSKNVLRSVCEKAKDVSLLYSLRQMVNYLAMKGEIKLGSCFCEDYVIPIMSFEHYVRHSFELLDSERRQRLFKDNWPIYTTTHNTPPALYGDDAVVSNSFIANGCIIKGKVKNSILSRGVKVEEGAVVEDSIIFTQSEIGADVRVKYVVADKYSHLIEVKKLNGEKEEMLYIGKGETV